MKATLNTPIDSSVIASRLNVPIEKLAETLENGTSRVYNFLVKLENEYGVENVLSWKEKLISATPTAETVIPEPEESGLVTVEAEKPRFEEIPLEVVDETEPAPKPQPKAKATHRVAPGFAEIRKALSLTCQAVMMKDIASIVHDATQGKMPLPPVFLSGFAGLGKTYGVSLIARLLDTHKLIELPPGFTARMLKKALVDNWTEPFILFLDEMHDMDAGCKNLLKALTETNGRVKEFTLAIGSEEYTIEIDPRKHLFIGASNEPIKDSALVGASGRFRDCQFLPYSDADKSVIMDALAETYLPDVDLPAATRKIIARNCRPFARSIKMMLERLRTEQKTGTDISTEAGVKQAIKDAGYYPGGWRGEHVGILTFLAASPAGRQVQEIAQGPMRGASSGQASALLAELMQGDLIVTLGNGRKAATDTAVKLLKSLEAKK